MPRNYPYHPQAKRGPDIPWEMIAPHESQAQNNHGQTLRRLAERGGLCPIEMVAVLTDSRYDRYMVEDTAIEKLQSLVAAYRQAAARRGFSKHEFTGTSVRLQDIPVSAKTRREAARDMKADMYGENGNG